MVGFRNEFIGDITMDAKSSKTATLTIGNKNYDFPILSGTVGPDVIDIAKLYGQAGVFTYDPGFTSTGWPIRPPGEPCRTPPRVHLAVHIAISYAFPDAF